MQALHLCLSDFIWGKQIPGERRKWHPDELCRDTQRQTCLRHLPAASVHQVHSEPRPSMSPGKALSWRSDNPPPSLHSNPQLQPCWHPLAKISFKVKCCIYHRYCLCLLNALLCVKQCYCFYEVPLFLFFVTYISTVLLSPFFPLAVWFLLCDLKEHGSL